MSDLGALTIEEYAEEYLRSQTSIRRGSEYLGGLAKRPPPLLEGLIPERTITMLSAEPGSGKTALTLAMSLALATKGAVLNHHVREKKRVLYLGQDAPTWDYAELLRKLARGMSITAEALGDPGIDFMLNQGGSLVNKQFLAGLQQWHESVGYEVVIFDTLLSFHDLDENDSRQMGAIMAILKRLRDQFGCTVIFTHHTRKPQGEESTSANYRSRGSSVIPGSIDFHLALRRGPGGRIFYTLAKGRGSEKLPPNSHFILQEGDGQDGPWLRLDQMPEVKNQ